MNKHLQEFTAASVNGSLLTQAAIRAFVCVAIVQALASDETAYDAQIRIRRELKEAFDDVTFADDFTIVDSKENINFDRWHLRAKIDGGIVEIKPS